MTSTFDESTQTRSKPYHRLCVSNNLDTKFGRRNRCLLAAESWGVSTRFFFYDDIYDNMKHAVQDPYLHHYGCDLKRNRARLNLGWLATCKKIHGEASLVLYQNHKFVFNTPRTLADFFGVSDSPNNPLSSNQQPSARFEIQNLQIHAIIQESNDIDTWVRVCSSVCLHLTNLRNLQLSINLAYKIPRHLDDLKLETNENNIRGLTGFCVLGRAGLENAIVDIVDPAFAHKHIYFSFMDLQDVYRWTAEEKRELAAKMKDELLRPGTHWQGAVPASLPAATASISS